MGVVECDCDGQHIIENVNKCADLLIENPQIFILGVRDFNSKNVPFRSRFGNKCTSFVFSAFCGLKISDTQTGLKGVPKSYIPILIETAGKRFEYASSVLLQTKKDGVEILEFPIHTIYLNGNETSHFNPLLDSIRIYSLLFKYMLVTLSFSLVDLIFFAVLIALLINHVPLYIMLAAYIARFLSGTVAYIANKTAVSPIKWIVFVLFWLRFPAA